MKNAHTERLIEWWGHSKGSGLHPEDECFMQSRPGGQKRLITDELCPIPYVGELRTAKLVVVMLNPGYDVRSQALDEQHEKTMLLNCLRQLPGTSFWPLTIKSRPDGNPPASSRYWRSIFRSFVTSRPLPEEETYLQIARSTCCVQLVPYHSKRAPDVETCRQMPSVRQMTSWIHAEISARQRPMIIFRGWPYLRELQNREPDDLLVAYKPGATFLRRPSFNPQGSLSKNAAEVLADALNKPGQEQ